MSCIDERIEELELVDEVVREIEAGVSPDELCDDGETIRVQLLGFPGWKLSSIIFTRRGLQRLGHDPNRKVKIEYLRKDIARAGKTRHEYHYPRKPLLRGI